MDPQANRVSGKFRPGRWDIYRRGSAAARMRFVSISDHKATVSTAWHRSAHLDDTFLSTEVTTYFPEDGCKIHCLVSGISEEQFRMIQQLQQRYLRLPAVCIGPGHCLFGRASLFRVNDQLTVEHLEKLLVMFNRFEGINGTRDPRASELVSLIFP